MLDQYALTCLERSWPRLVALVGQIASVLQGREGAPGRQAHIGAQALLRMAEAMLRRILVLMAADLPLPKGKATTPPVDTHTATRDRGPVILHVPASLGLAVHIAMPEPTRHTRTPNPPRPPRFRLTEHVPTIDAAFSMTAATPTPGAPNFASQGNSTSPNLDRTLRRLAALQDAMAHPDREARRMARWLAQGHANWRHARINPIRTGRPPGFNRSRMRRDKTQQSLWDLTCFAHRTARELAYQNTS